MSIFNLTYCNLTVLPFINFGFPDDISNGNKSDLCTKMNYFMAVLAFIAVAAKFVGYFQYKYLKKQNARSVIGSNVSERLFSIIKKDIPIFNLSLWEQILNHYFIVLLKLTKEASGSCLP